MAGELFLRRREKQELEVLGWQLFALLNVTSGEVRHSDNVYGGRYLVGQTCGLSVRVELADDSDFASYDFLLSFEPVIWEPGTGPINLDTFADVIAKFLAYAGWEVARPLAFGTTDAAAVEYKARSD